ncbi:MAG: hypothetical protein IKQ40_03690, partial [Lachnospiraceae bacterium]|nr:hypothetical protein [Lachnospiraceae bacterium]
MKRCLALILSGVLILGILPVEPVFGYEESGQIDLFSEEGSDLTADETVSEELDLIPADGSEEGITVQTEPQTLQPDMDGEGENEFPPEDATAVTLDDEVSVENVNTSTWQYFVFTPEETGLYCLETGECTPDSYPCRTLYDDEGGATA